MPIFRMRHCTILQTFDLIKLIFINFIMNSMIVNTCIHDINHLNGYDNFHVCLLTTRVPRKYVKILKCFSSFRSKILKKSRTNVFLVLHVIYVEGLHPQLHYSLLPVSKELMSLNSRFYFIVMN